MSIVAEEILPPEREDKADKSGFLYDVGAGVIDRRDGGGGVRYVECHPDDTFTTLQCELSPKQIIDMYNNGEIVVMRSIVEGEDEGYTYKLDDAFYFESATVQNNDVTLVFGKNRIGIMPNQTLVINRYQITVAGNVFVLSKFSKMIS